MFLAVPTTSSPFFFFRKLFCLLAGLCLAFVANVAATNTAVSQAEAGLRLELPANGNLRVENLRGGVIAELWSENYVSVSAITDSGQESRSPAIVQRTDSLISMRVRRGANQFETEDSRARSCGNRYRRKLGPGARTAGRAPGPNDLWRYSPRASQWRERGCSGGFQDRNNLVFASVSRR